MYAIHETLLGGIEILNKLQATINIHSIYNTRFNEHALSIIMNVFATCNQTMIYLYVFWHARFYYRFNYLIGDYNSLTIDLIDLLLFNVHEIQILQGEPK